MAFINKPNLQLLGNKVWELCSLGKRLKSVAKVDKKGGRRAGFQIVLVRVFIIVKTHHDHGNS